MDEYELEDAGFLDGSADATYGNGMYGSFGMSIDEDELTDEEREIYERGYIDGYQANEEL